ncbi:hypothetical protein [Polycladomyces subterraneus]|uniref:Lipoprotein n=1 Tax=Polycladomyces subterraneus TaxID=1016997 RepID=A0ABT8IRS2_9BACL|nr:hypothetical protein [Polycladomyces subterraneus]MDN4595505.1 hypothetical protein [Polycladomyces subterraneus]
MRKCWIAWCAVLMLTGCSTFADYYAASCLVNEMNPLVQQDAAYLSLMKQFQHLQQQQSQLEDALAETNKSNAKTVIAVLKLIDRQSRLIQQAEKINQRAWEKLPKLKRWAADIDRKEPRVWARKVTTLWDARLKLRIQAVSLIQRLLQQEKTYFVQLQQGKRPVQGPDSTLSDRYEQLTRQLYDQTTAFNQAWTTFNYLTTAKPVASRKSQ